MGTFGFIWCCLPIGPLGFLLLLLVLFAVLYIVFPGFRLFANALLVLMLLVAIRHAFGWTALILVLAAPFIFLFCCALHLFCFMARECRKADRGWSLRKEWTEYRRRKEEERVRRRTEILRRRHEARRDEDLTRRVRAALEQIEE